MELKVAEHVRLVLQVWNEQDPNGETLAFVVRTGLCTTMGLMLRRVMAPLNISAVPFAKVSSDSALKAAPNTVELQVHGSLEYLSCPCCQIKPSSALRAASTCQTAAASAPHLGCTVSSHFTAFMSLAVLGKSWYHSPMGHSTGHAILTVAVNLRWTAVHPACRHLAQDHTSPLQEN